MVVSRRRRTLAALGLVACTVLAGCGSDGDGDAAAPASSPGSAGVTATGSPTSGPAPPSSGTPTGPASGPADYAAAELDSLVARIFALAEAERAQGAKVTFYATQRNRAEKLVAKVAQTLPRLLTSHPSGATADIDYVVASYDERSLLRCADRQGDLNVVLVVDRDGLTFSTFVATADRSRFLILDHANRGNQSFDENGYAQGQGGCESAGDYQPLVSREVAL